MWIKKVGEWLKKITYKNILALLFVAVILIMCVTTVFNSFNDILSPDENYEKNFSSLIKKTDDRYYDLLDFESPTLINKGSYINLNGFIANAMGQKEMKDVVKLKNGQLSFFYRSELDITPIVEQMTKLSNKQKENGKEFLFVLSPYKISKYENELPKGFFDYGNICSDNLLELLKENDVPILDLREEMYNDNISYQEAFYNTDHHWRAETGFWAYTKMVDCFVEKNIIEAPDTMYTDINQYNVEVRENYFLGSLSQRTGVYYGGIDDFSFITPKFDVENISVNIPYSGIYKEGSFFEVTFDIPLLENKKSFTGSPREAIGNNNTALIEYKNPDAENSLKVLGIGDSYTNDSCVYLPLIFQTYSELDMRHYKDNFMNYYSEYNPDIIIVMINAGTLIQENSICDFFGDSSN